MSHSSALPTGLRSPVHWLSNDDHKSMLNPAVHPTHASHSAAATSEPEPAEAEAAAAWCEESKDDPRADAHNAHRKPDTICADDNEQQTSGQAGAASGALTIPAAAAAAASSSPTAAAAPSPSVLISSRPSRRSTAVLRCEVCAAAGAKLRELLMGSVEASVYPLLCEACFKQNKKDHASAKKAARELTMAAAPAAAAAVGHPTLQPATASRKRKSTAATQSNDALPNEAAASTVVVSSVPPLSAEQLAERAAATEAALANADAASRAKMRQRPKSGPSFSESLASAQAASEARLQRKRTERSAREAAAAAAPRSGPRSKSSVPSRRSLRHDRRSKRARRAPNKFKIEVGSSSADSEEEASTDASHEPATPAAAAVPSVRRSVGRRRASASASSAASPAALAVPAAPWDSENDSWPSEYENTVEMQFAKRDTSNALHKLWAHADESLSYPPLPLRVAILGAGVSGLVAAHQLASRGFHVIIVEARKRIGGRILTWQLPSLAQPPTAQKKGKTNLTERGAATAAAAASPARASAAAASSGPFSRGPLAGSSLPVDLGAAFLHGCDPDGLNPVYEFLRQQRNPHPITLTTKFDTNDAIYCRTKRAVEQRNNGGETGPGGAASSALAPAVRVSRRRCERAWDRYEQLDVFMLDQSQLLHAHTRRQRLRRKRLSLAETVPAIEPGSLTAAAASSAACSAASAVAAAAASASSSSGSSSDQSELSLDSDFGMDVAFDTALQQLDEAETEAKERQRVEEAEENEVAAKPVALSSAPHGAFQSLSPLDVDLLHLVSATQHAYVAPMRDLSLKDLAECFEAGVLGGGYKVVSPDAHGYSSIILALRARLAKMPNVEFRMGTEVNTIEYGLANEDQQLQQAIAQARDGLNGTHCTKVGQSDADASAAPSNADWPPFTRDFALPPDFASDSALTSVASSAAAAARSTASSAAAAAANPVVPAAFQESEFGLLPPLSSTTHAQAGQSISSPSASPPLSYASASPVVNASDLGSRSLGVRLHTATVEFDEFASTSPPVDRRGMRCTTTGAGVVDRSHSVAGTIEADFALVTASIGVLQRDLIRFSPALPEAKSHAIRSLGMGCENKVILQFAPDRIFWGPAESAGHVHYLRLVEEHRYKFLNLHAFGVVGVLVAQAPPPHSRKISSLTDAQVLDEVLGILRAMFGARAVPAPLRTHITRWHDDPYAFGSYSFIAKGSGANMIREYARSIPPLFFSGEGSHPTDGQTVQGAWLSAVAAARDITKHALSLPASFRSVRSEPHEKLYLPRSHFESQRRRMQLEQDQAAGFQGDDEEQADLAAEASEAATAANHKARAEANRKLRMRGRNSKGDTRLLQQMQRMMSARRAAASEANAHAAAAGSAVIVSSPIVIEDASTDNDDDDDGSSAPAAVASVSSPPSVEVEERPAKRPRANNQAAAGGHARPAAAGSHNDRSRGHSYATRRPAAAVQPDSPASTAAAAAVAASAAAAVPAVRASCLPSSPSCVRPPAPVSPVAPVPLLPPEYLSVESATAAAAAPASSRPCSHALLQSQQACRQQQPQQHSLHSEHQHAYEAQQHAAAMMHAAAARDQQQRAMREAQWHQQQQQQHPLQPPPPLHPYWPAPPPPAALYPPLLCSSSPPQFAPAAPSSAYSPAASFASMLPYPLSVAPPAAHPMDMHDHFTQHANRMHQQM